MSNLVYLNGDWIDRQDATISVLDRGFIFADGVYEVVRYCNGQPVAMPEHVIRMRNSLQALRIDLPIDIDDLAEISNQAVARNNLTDAAAYWQITRGPAPRKHKFPPPDTPPTIFVMADPAEPLILDAPTPCLTAVTVPDVRWHKCAIKSISLLPNILAAQAAVDADCDEAIMIRDNIVTEGSARTIAIVKNDILRTHPLGDEILSSITRQVTLELAREAGITVDETRFPPDQLFDADEVLALGTTTDVAAVTHIDTEPINAGQPGLMAQRLSTLYRQYAAAQCGIPIP